MRGRLRALGASEAEQKSILDRIVKEQASFGSFGSPQTTPSAFTRLAASMDRTVATITQEPAAKTPPLISKIKFYLSSCSNDLKQYAAKANSGENISPALTAHIIRQMSSYVDRQMNQTDMSAYLSSNDEFRRSLADLKWALFEETERWALFEETDRLSKKDANDSLGRPQVVQEVDNFLMLVSGSAKGAERRPTPSVTTPPPRE
jgi:hypothetical protein